MSFALELMFGTEELRVVVDHLTSVGAFAMKGLRVAVDHRVLAVTPEIERLNAAVGWLALVVILGKEDSLVVVVRSGLVVMFEMGDYQAVVAHFGPAVVSGMEEWRAVEDQLTFVASLGTTDVLVAAYLVLVEILGKKGLTVAVAHSDLVVVAEMEESKAEAGHLNQLILNCSVEGFGARYAPQVRYCKA